MMENKLPKINPSTTKSWQRLEEHRSETQSAAINDHFESEKHRFDAFSLLFNDFLFDYSKNAITHDTMDLLFDLANECHLSAAIESMYSAEKINETENRAVLHTALRNFSDEPIYVDGQNIVPSIQAERKKIKQLCENIRNGKWLGCTGKPLRNIVNIGIGGSDLGSAMVTEALRPYWDSNIQPFYISNIDGSNLVEVLKQIDFTETLFLVASKTFTTQETMTNANFVRESFVAQIGDESAIGTHFVAITGNLAEAQKFGIPNSNTFQVWDWVGGRFSLWGSMGISIALTIGYNHFEELLKGANQMDVHFRNEDFKSNIPVIMGLLSIWNINFLKAKSEAVLAYDHYLSKFKSYLQQCMMESNGKNIDRNGHTVSYQTGVVIWGETGTNGQHSFFQLLHQGTDLIPCDFIMTVNSQHDMTDHHNKLLSNALAQTEALMKGKNVVEAEKELPDDKKHLAAYKSFSGNRPSNTILIKELTPRNLGSLIALYEHKTFVQGIIWNIFSFDQWGVELGKKLSSDKLKALKNNSTSKIFDSSTQGLIDQIIKWNN